MDFRLNNAIQRLAEALTDILNGSVVLKVSNPNTGKIADGFTVRFIKEG